MNTLQITLLRALATLCVTFPLTSCSTAGDSAQPPVVTAATPTGAIEVLPTPTPAQDVTTSPPVTPVPPSDESWRQESFGEAWTIGFPADWTVDAAGAHEGALQLTGNYEGHSYIVTYSYPIGILAESLEVWVEGALLPLTLEQREAVVVSDVMVANTPAKKVLKMPAAGGEAASHHVYIWRSESKNPRLITITQNDGQPVDDVAMDQLLDRLLLAVQ